MYTGADIIALISTLACDLFHTKRLFHKDTLFKNQNSHFASTAYKGLHRYMVFTTTPLTSLVQFKKQQFIINIAASGDRNMTSV